MQVSKFRVPAILASGIVGIGLGVWIGVLWMGLYGYEVRSPEAIAARSGGGSPGGGGGGGEGRGFRGPGPKSQLVSLVIKLDVLTQKPLEVTLSDDQKKKVADQLQGLEAKEAVNDEDAKQRLDALLEIFKDQRATLEAAGYRWPGQGAFRPSADAPNPFKDEKNGAALKSFVDRLSQPAAK